MLVSVKSPEDATMLSKQMKHGPWLVLFHAEWCGHCQQMKPEWKKFTRSIPKGLNVADVENNFFSSLEKTPEIRGFPTVKMFNDNQEVDEFTAERTGEQLKVFADSNMKTLNHKNHNNNNNNNNTVEHVDELVKKHKKNVKSHKKSNHKNDHKNAHKNNHKNNMLLDHELQNELERVDTLPEEEDKLFKTIKTSKKKSKKRKSNKPKSKKSNKSNKKSNKKSKKKSNKKSKKKSKKVIKSKKVDMLEPTNEVIHQGLLSNSVLLE